MSALLDTVYSEVSFFERALRRAHGATLANLVSPDRQAEWVDRLIEVFGEDTPKAKQVHISIINDVLHEIAPRIDLNSLSVFWPKTGRNKAVAAELTRMGMSSLAAVAQNSASSELRIRRKMSPRKPKL